MPRKPKETQFAKESQALVPAETTRSLAALFTTQSGEFDEKKIERLNLPRLVKPDQVPIWTTQNPVLLQGLIHKICPSQKSTIKGFVVWLRLPTGDEITFPITGVVRNALAPGIKLEDGATAKDREELKTALEKHIGKVLILKRLPNGMSQTFKKEMFMFDCFLAKP